MDILEKLSDKPKLVLLMVAAGMMPAAAAAEEIRPYCNFQPGDDLVRLTDAVELATMLVAGKHLSVTQAMEDLGIKPRPKKPILHLVERAPHQMRERNFGREM